MHAHMLKVILKEWESFINLIASFTNIIIQPGITLFVVMGAYSNLSTFQN